jgi:transposase
MERRKAMAIDVVVQRVAGLDIAKASLVACVRVPGSRKGWQLHKRKFATTTKDLLALATWLAEHEVTLVGMESTSAYWKPVFYLLESRFECWLLNAGHMKAVPGRKTDIADAEWIADLIAHGLVRPSFVPPPPIRRLRDLTRRRTLLLAERSREKQRMEKLLEDAGVKLSIVASDIFGASGRLMIEALIGGERDGAVLADLAVGRLRRKTAVLRDALVGRFDDHHGFLASMILWHINAIDAMIADLDTRIGAEIEPYRAQVELLDSVPGIAQRAAEVIIAETGADMSRFATAAHLASWAGVCPSNNKTAGKAKPGHVRPGDKWLKAALGVAALSSIRAKDSHAYAQFRRIAARRGSKRAQSAVAHSLLVAMWHILTDRAPYHDLGADFYTDREHPDRQRRRAIAQLERLGYAVTIEPTTA